MNTLFNALSILDGSAVCGDPTVQKVMGIVKLLILVICIAVPIVLIILGSFDLFKAVTAGKDEDIKKKQQTLIKRIIAGVIVFLVPTIVTVLMNLIGAEDWKVCWNNSDASFQALFDPNADIDMTTTTKKND